MPGRLIVSVLLAISVFGTACSPPALTGSEKPQKEATLEKTVVSYSGVGAQFGVLWVAKAAGLFQKNGLDVELVSMQGGTQAMQALVAGNSHFSLAGAATVISAKAGGADLALIATAVPVMTSSLVALESIKTIQDLKGKKLGIVSRGGATDIEARWLLNKYGLQADVDVALVALGSSAALSAGLASRGVDAAITANISESRMKGMGVKVLVDILDEGKKHEGQAISTSRSLIKDRPDFVRRFVRAYVEGIHQFKTQKESTIAVLKANQLSEDPDELDELYTKFARKVFPRVPYLSEEGVQSVLDGAAQDNPKVRDLRPADVTDNSFVKDLDDSGFIKKLYGE